MHFKNEKKITMVVVVGFLSLPILAIVSTLIFPPDLTANYPVYHPNNIMMMACGSALLMGGLTVMSVKLADEKKVLPAAGFTMLAISCGINLASIFEISAVVNYESYEKFYRIQTSGNFLFLPAMFLVAEFEVFKKWVKIAGIISSLTLILASSLFLFGNRDFRFLENISNLGYLIMFLTYFGWGHNIYKNYTITTKS